MTPNDLYKLSRELLTKYGEAHQVGRAAAATMSAVTTNLQGEAETAMQLWAQITIDYPQDPRAHAAYQAACDLHASTMETNPGWGHAPDIDIVNGY